MTRRVGVLVVLFALGAAACAGDDAGDGTDTTTTATVTTTDGAPSTSTTAAPATTSTRATTTTSPPPTTDVEVATINVLHGLPFASNCGDDTDHCDAPARIDMLWDLIDTQTGCPEIVALQEISPRQQELVPQKLPDLCEGTHELLTESLGLPDQEMILTTLPVIDHRRFELAGAPTWSAHWARLDADGTTVDVFATHYASSSFNPACDDSQPITTCSPACPPGISLGGCHPVETLEILDAEAAEGSLQLVVGDLNASIDESRIITLTDVGFVDAYLAAGLPECDPATGVGCTCCVGGETPYDGLDVAEHTLESRIDFVLARAPEGCEVAVESGDADGDGTSTGHWADAPLPEPVAGLFWAADHAGVVADLGLDCGA